MKIDKGLAWVRIIAPVVTDFGHGVWVMCSGVKRGWIIFDLSEGEQEFMQANTNHVYDIFLNRVAEGRNMEYDEVAKIAKGRVYIGGRAKEIGLVDEIGNLDDAIASAVELAGLENYRTKEYPIQPDPMTEFINELTGQGDDDAISIDPM